ncbi:MAG: TetR/AcrR family transcriptional regulator [Lachnospiraceae bacterium]|jgi:AcrR family transcriptional regulator
MDKRIYKTKKGLREALKSLLAEKPFDKINVTEICRRSQTSRVTFYTYYNDKYDLLDDMYKSLADDAQEIFIRLQEKNNQEESFEKSVQNILDTLLSFENNPAFSSANMVIERDIIPIYHDFLLECIKRFEIKYPEHMQTRYPIDALNSFFAAGMWGFIHSHPGPATEDDIREARVLLTDLVNSNIFIRQK